MAIISTRYRVYCQTEDDYFYVWLSDDDGAPTTCPNNSAHTIDTNQTTIVETIEKKDVNVVSSSAVMDIHQHDLVDMTGKNYYKYGSRLAVDASASTNIFLISFASYLYIQGGGYWVLPEIYQSGTLVTQKPEDGDQIGVDMVDIDNVLGYGKTATVSNVARSSNVVTITTSADHTFVTGELVHVDVDDDTFDEMEVEIQSTPTSTTFTYNQTGSDVSEKSAAGDVGKIVVLSPFVAGDYIGPRSMWELESPDGKLIPPGIYLRFRITSTGSNDYVIYTWLNMRTYSG